MLDSEEILRTVRLGIAAGRLPESTGNNVHSYHTKVPHKTILRYVLHYTEPGDVVLDGFCGSGMTHVAA